MLQVLNSFYRCKILSPVSSSFLVLTADTEQLKQTMTYSNLIGKMVVIGSPENDLNSTLDTASTRH